MKYWLYAALMPIAVPVQAQPPATLQETAGDVRGHYYLQGLRETGSELLLDDDGAFQWYLVYGALDLFAQGHWSREGNQVTLISQPADGYPSPPWSMLHLRIDGDTLIPNWDDGLVSMGEYAVPPGEHGAYILADKETDTGD